jgi:hypothetical protein
MLNEQSTHSEAVVFVLRALQQSSQPMNVSKLAKAVPKSALKVKTDLPELLQELVKAGQVRSHQARSAVYWLPKLEEQAGARVLEALNDVPLTQTELKSKLRSLLVGWPLPKRNEIIDLLIKEKRVYKVAPLAGKAKLLSAHAELTPQDYIKLSLRLAVAKLKPMGFTAEQVFAATYSLLQQGPTVDKPSVQSAPKRDFGNTILERMIQLKLAAANGALVSLSDLRRSLAAEIPDKSAFDRAVLRLAESDRVALHRHDYPGGLSLEERDALVVDDRGDYFVGIALRV